MKKLLLLSILSLIFISCEGPMGPPGRDGFDGVDGRDGADGADGINIVGQMFEATVSFNSDNEYKVFVDIPSQIEVFDTDIILAYILVGEYEGRDIWEPLPQTLFFENKILLYGYDYTYFDVSFFLDGTVNLDFLDASFTDDIIFRVAVLPADQVQGLDLNNMDNVLNAIGNKEIIKLH